MEPLLLIDGLCVDFALRAAALRAVNNVSLSVGRGERVGIVGESGAGKSVLGFSIINLVSKPGFIAAGRVVFQGEEISSYSYEQMRKIRGNRISMIFQDPMMTLNPVLTIGEQMRETVQAHMQASRSEADKICLDKLRKVHISSPEKRLNQYPHEFSGGMRQRIIIAISMLTNPDLIIADEPTTALDVTIQAEIMGLLLELCASEHMGLILITHDLAVVSQVTKKIAVMYAGTIVELGTSEAVVHDPLHPYTRGLISALPENAGSGGRLNQIPGVMPGLARIPDGCPFRNRCTSADESCLLRPELQVKGNGTSVACHKVRK